MQTRICDLYLIIQHYNGMKSCYWVIAVQETRSTVNSRPNWKNPSEFKGNDVAYRSYDIQINAFSSE